MIFDFLNKKNSLRNLTDEEFEKLLPTLSKELSFVNFYPRYTEKELLDDWSKLIRWNPTARIINSTSRVGMKLCEHFFENFYDIEDSKGNSFKKMWSDTELLKKVLVWNRKSHTTPYLSELKRGVYFCGGLPKSTMYRPQLAKMITFGSNVVLDPCMGWGGRLLGTISNFSHYIGFEPNTKTFEGLSELVDFLGVKNMVTLINDDAMNIDNYDLPMVDCIVTSPPYFNLEVYSHEKTQSVYNTQTYKEWENNFLKPLVKKCVTKLNDGGKSCWNVARVGKNDMWDSIDESHRELEFYPNFTYQIQSSARQVNQPNNKNKKSVDKTVVYLNKNPIKESFSSEKFLSW